MRSVLVVLPCPETEIASVIIREHRLLPLVPRRGCGIGHAVLRIVLMDGALDRPAAEEKADNARLATFGDVVIAGMILEPVFHAIVHVVPRRIVARRHHGVSERDPPDHEWKPGLPMQLGAPRAEFVEVLLFPPRTGSSVRVVESRIAVADIGEHEVPCARAKDRLRAFAPRRVPREEEVRRVAVAEEAEGLAERGGRVVETLEGREAGGF